MFSIGGSTDRNLFGGLLFHVKCWQIIKITSTTINSFVPDGKRRNLCQKKKMEENTVNVLPETKIRLAINFRLLLFM